MIASGKSDRQKAVDLQAEDVNHILQIIDAVFKLAQGSKACRAYLGISIFFRTRTKGPIGDLLKSFLPGDNPRRKFFNAARYRYDGSIRNVFLGFRINGSVVQFVHEVTFLGGVDFPD